MRNTDFMGRTMNSNTSNPSKGALIYKEHRLIYAGNSSGTVIPTTPIIRDTTYMQMTCKEHKIHRYG